MSIFYRKILSPNKPVFGANTTVKINVLIKKSLASGYSRKIFEQGLVTYNDLSDEIINILKSKKEEIINKLEIPSKEEFEVLKKRVENLEKKQNLKKTKKNKSKR